MSTDVEVIDELIGDEAEVLALSGADVAAPTAPAVAHAPPRPRVAPHAAPHGGPHPSPSALGLGLTQPASLVAVAARLALPPDPAALFEAAEAQAETALPRAALWTVFWRSVRTLGPIVAADVVALAVSGVIVQALLHLVCRPAADAVKWSAAPAALLPLVFAYWVSDLYAEIWVHVVIEFRKLTQVTTVALLAAAVGALAALPLPLWFLAAWPVAVALVPLFRTIAHALCARRAWWGYPTLVIGSATDAAAVATSLRAAPRSGLRPALLTAPLTARLAGPHGQGADRGGLPQASLSEFSVPVANDAVELEAIVREKAIRHAVVLLPDLPHRRLGEELDRYSRLIPHLLVLSDCSALPTLWSTARNGGRLSGIEVRNGLLLATLQAAKRATDVAVVLLAMLLGLPVVLLAAAALVKLGDGGPVFYGHTRIGRRGRAFRAWKFRTMRPDSDDILRDLLARDPDARAQWERDHKLSDDPRVTRFGRFLRITSLDELPQLWNVLKGDMSLVGPRPIVRDEVRRYGEVFPLYATVKPGITGLWQVSGRNDVGYEERVRLDEFYVRHWSPWLDVYILAKTLAALVSRRGAY